MLNFHDNGILFRTTSGRKKNAEESLPLSGAFDCRTKRRNHDLTQRTIKIEGGMIGNIQ